MIEMGVGYQKGTREGGHETGAQVGRRGGRWELKVVKGGIGALLFEDIGERTKPGAALDNDGAVLPVLIGWLEQVAGAVAFERATTCAETDKAEGSGLVLGMQGDTRLLASAVVVGRVEGLVRVGGSSAKVIAGAGGAFAGAR